MYSYYLNLKLFTYFFVVSKVMFIFVGRVGPVVERSTSDREVRGSNPTLA